MYILNRAGQSRTGGSRTPYEMWTGKKPDLSHIRVFGCDVYARTPKQHITKFEARARKAILVGYENDSKNYRLYDSKTRSVFVSRHVSFKESNTAEDSDEEGATEAYLPLPETSDDNREAVGNHEAVDNRVTIGNRSIFEGNAGEPPDDESENEGNAQQQQGIGLAAHS